MDDLAAADVEIEVLDGSHLFPRDRLPKEFAQSQHFNVRGNPRHERHRSRRC